MTKQMWLFCHFVLTVVALLAVTQAVITSLTGRGKNDHLCGKHSVFKIVLRQQGCLRQILGRCCLVV